MLSVYLPVVFSVAEVADPQYLVYHIYFFYIGIVFSFIIGSYVSYTIAGYIYLIFPVAFGSLFVLMPDTPQYLIGQGRIQEAKKSLMFYRNSEFNESIRCEFAKPTNYTIKLKQKKLSMSDFRTKRAQRGICIAIFLALFKSFNGTFIFTTNIFMNSGTNFDVKISSIIIGCVQLMGAILSTILIDRFGRKRLLIMTSLGSGIGLTTMGIYEWFALNDYDVSNVSWVPIISISISVFSSCVGIIPIAVILLPEIFPSQIRLVCTKIGYSLIQFCLAMIVILFPILTDLFELYTTMWSMAAICLLGFFYAIFFINDTTGEDLHKIDNINNNNNI